MLFRSTLQGFMHAPEAYKPARASTERFKGLCDAMHMCSFMQGHSVRFRSLKVMSTKQLL